MIWSPPAGPLRGIILHQDPKVSTPKPSFTDHQLYYQHRVSHVQLRTHVAESFRKMLPGSFNIIQVALLHQHAAPPRQHHNDLIDHLASSIDHLHRLTGRASTTSDVLSELCQRSLEIINRIRPQHRSASSMLRRHQSQQQIPQHHHQTRHQAMTMQELSNHIYALEWSNARTTLKKNHKRKSITIYQNIGSNIRIDIRLSLQTTHRLQPQWWFQNLHWTYHPHRGSQQEDWQDVHRQDQHYGAQDNIGIIINIINGATTSKPMRLAQTTHILNFNIIDHAIHNPTSRQKTWPEQPYHRNRNIQIEQMHHQDKTLQAQPEREKNN